MLNQPWSGQYILCHHFLHLIGMQESTGPGQKIMHTHSLLLYPTIRYMFKMYPYKASSAHAYFNANYTSLSIYFNNLHSISMIHFPSQI